MSLAQRRGVEPETGGVVDSSYNIIEDIFERVRKFKRVGVSMLSSHPCNGRHGQFEDNGRS